MATLVTYTIFVSLFVLFLFLCAVSFAENSHFEARKSDGLEIHCGEVKVRITVKRQFFRERGIPFKPEYLRLGANRIQRSFSCSPKGPTTGSELVISAGLRQCGTKSRVHGEWLVYSNQLFLFPAVVSLGSVVRGAATIIPIECHYKRKLKVNGGPLSPTWVPMTSTVSVFGLLHFSLRVMSDGCNSLLSSSIYQQGEAVFLEASVEAPLHPPLTLYVDSCVATLKPDPLATPSYKFITNHGCHMDSVLQGSPGQFLLRQKYNRLCFSVQAFHLSQKPVEQMFISCHLRATLKQNPNNHIDKACFFHRPTHSWRATEGDSALCDCCDSADCFRLTGERRSGQTGHPTQPETEKKHEAKKTIGPLHIMHSSH